MNKILIGWVPPPSYSDHQNYFFNWGLGIPTYVPFTTGTDWFSPAFSWSWPFLGLIIPFKLEIYNPKKQTWQGDKCNHSWQWRSRVFFPIEPGDLTFLVILVCRWVASGSTLDALHAPSSHQVVNTPHGSAFIWCLEKKSISDVLGLVNLEYTPVYPVSFAGSISSQNG